MQERARDGFTLIELLIVVGIIGTIAAIAVPGLMRARISGNEASAIGSLRSINSAEATYASSCGQGNYAGTLADLGKPPQAGSEGFISADLVTDPSQKAGYTITMTAGAAAAAGTGCNSPSSLSQTVLRRGCAAGRQLDRVQVLRDESGRDDLPVDRDAARAGGGHTGRRAGSGSAGTVASGRGGAGTMAGLPRGRRGPGRRDGRLARSAERSPEPTNRATTDVSGAGLCRHVYATGVAASNVNAS